MSRDSRGSSSCTRRVLVTGEQLPQPVIWKTSSPDSPSDPADTPSGNRIRAASPPKVVMASRIATRSTTQGTPVKSCISTRAGVNAIGGHARPAAPVRQRLELLGGDQPAVSLRSRFSSMTFRLYGNWSAPSIRPSR